LNPPGKVVIVATSEVGAVWNTNCVEGDVLELDAKITPLFPKIGLNVTVPGVRLLPDR
jgi:hypothetical protein